MALTAAQVAQAVLLTEQGQTQPDVAAILKVSLSALKCAIKRHRETGLVIRQPGVDRLRCPSTRDERIFTLAVLRNRILRRRLLAARGMTGSEDTVRRRTREHDLVLGQDLKRHYRITQLRFPWENANCTMDQWSTVLFTEESRRALRALEMYKRREERFLPITTHQTDGYQGGSVMIWEWVFSDAFTELVIVDDHLIAKYFEKMLQDVVAFINIIG